MKKGKLIILFIVSLIAVTLVKTGLKQVVPKDSYYYKELFTHSHPKQVTLGDGLTVIITLPIVYLAYRLDTKRAKINSNDLKTNGTLVFADNITVRTMNNANGGVVYFIICEWIDEITNEKRVFCSKAMFNNPELIIQKRGVEKIPVYIDKRKKDLYYVDVEELMLDKEG